jgi:hypothetical protein
LQGFVLLVWISYIYPMEAKSSHLIHVFHVMAMCRTAHVWFAKYRFLSVLFWHNVVFPLLYVGMTAGARGLAV